MESPITEILRLVAEGVIRPDEGQSLLLALREGYPEEFLAEPTGGQPAAVPSGEGKITRTTRVGRTPHGPGKQPPTGLGSEGPDRKSNGQSGPTVPDAGKAESSKRQGAGAGSTDSNGPTADAGPWPGSPPPPDAPAPVVPPPGADPGTEYEIPPDVILRISANRGSLTGDDPLSSIAVRGTSGQTVRVVRGSGVELQKDDGAWHLTWPGGMLFVEVPERMAGLELRGIPGSAGISGYAGPFAGEEVGGGLTVHGAASPFRIRDVRGSVRLLGLALRDGISTIASVVQDVEIETAREASVTIRASSRVAPMDGTAGLDAGGDGESDRSGRRGVWRVGAGTAQLNVSQVRGRLRLRPADGPESDKS